MGTEKQCNKMHICSRLYVTEKLNTDRQTDIQIYIKGEVKVAVILSKTILSRSKPLHAHVQYVFNESAKYGNLSTNSSSQDDFTMHVLS